MPSAFTHALVGAAAAQFLPPDCPRWRAAGVFALAATLPDLDVAAFALGIPYEHPFGHRGFAHSLAFALLLGAAAAFLVATTAAKDQSEPRNKIRWKPLVLVGFLALASHGVLDAATDAGLGIGFFIPFHDERYFFPFRPILTASVDPRDFFSREGFTIFRSEIVWVWGPVAVLFFTRVLLRKILCRATVEDAKVSDR
jgi:inner membrane protein